jgi:transposase
MQTEPTEPTSKRRNFDEAFKRDAVALLCKGDQPIKQLAQELGVSHWNLRDWKKRYGPPAPIRSSEVVETELRALRRENERLRAQCDILKKTLGILVEPSPNASRA